MASSGEVQRSLQAVAQGLRWTYAILWQLCPDQGALVWVEGHYNSAIKTRKTVQPAVAQAQAPAAAAEAADQARSRQLRELFDSLAREAAAGGGTGFRDVHGCAQEARRPSAALAPEDLTETEWFYLMSASYSFPSGVGYAPLFICFFSSAPSPAAPRCCPRRRPVPVVAAPAVPVPVVAAPSPSPSLPSASSPPVAVPVAAPRRLASPKMSSDDEKDFIKCEYCEDQRDLCDRNFLVDDRRFSIKQTFEVDTRIPGHARIFVLDKIGFSAMETMEVKIVYLKTEHGYTFNVKLYNADTYTYFECKTWQALCKAYAFEPGMVITFDIRPEDDIEGNKDIWVDVQTPPVLPLSYFHSSKHVRCLVDRTYYCPRAELNCEEISHYVSWLEDLHTVKTNFLPALGNVSTQNMRPIVIVLNYGHIYERWDSR
ncbi:uncharacterized protein [Aegilops tauschii subsp. strangulata]|uniref:uncharacterized protein n=1 Tax=Aegilops tauschii subsp. strangulata TaxID=200361 RepID=UPI003CC846B6